jgi:hypothetical protein
MEWSATSPGTGGPSSLVHVISGAANEQRLGRFEKWLPAIGYVTASKPWWCKAVQF